MSSKPRSIEAQRLESNYLSRLHEALGYISKPEAVEIEENVTAHIRAAVEELDTEEVGLTQMAAILEELGSPESLIVEPEVIEKPMPDWLEPEEDEASADPAPTASPALSPPMVQEGDQNFSELLDRIFAGYVILTIGLFVPVIELSFCAIIGYAVILWNLRRTSLPEFARGTSWATIALVGMVAMCPGALLALAVPVMGLFQGMIGIIVLVADIVLFWTLFTAIADGIEKRGFAELAGKARNHRIYYIIASFLILIAAIPLALIVAEERDVMVRSLVPLAILPLTWIVNWFVILRPLIAIRRSLREGV